MPGTIVSRRRIAALVAFAVYSFLGNAHAQPATSTALTGRVSSQEEGAMEGVLVSAKMDGGRVTITVVTDAKGDYRFPRTRLEPGHYALRIRAVGYELAEPKAVEIAAQKTAKIDLKLVKTKDIAAQMTNAEWLDSIPGAEKQKNGLLPCAACHTLERIFRSHYDAADLAKLTPRMARYSEGSTPDFPQPLLPSMPGRQGEYAGMPADEINFVTTVNLSSTPEWHYSLKTFPRLKGKSGHVIITEYDLPRKFVMPHDVAVDSKGNAWYCDDAHQFIGRLNLKTTDIQEYPIPVARPEHPKGCRDIYFDQAGNIWFATQGQGGVAKFDVKTEKMQVWKLSTEIDPNDNAIVIGVLPQYVNVDNKLWVLSTSKIGKTVEWLDVETGKWGPPIFPFKDIPKDSPAAIRPQSIYAIFTDSKNTCYFSDFGSEFIGKIDPVTRAITFYQTPTMGSVPRRGTMDAQDRLWFGEHNANKIGMFDTKTLQFKEWPVPTPFTEPYDVKLDDGGYAWTGGMFSDRVTRLNTKTNEMIEYMLPRSTNIRRVDVDNTTTPPSLVVGSTHSYTIVRVEPME